MLLDEFPINVIDSITSCLSIPAILNFGTTCYKARKLILSNVSKITHLEFNENNEIKYNNIDVAIDWDKNIMKHGFIFHYGLFIKNLKMYERTVNTKNDAKTIAFITLLFYEAIVNRSTGLKLSTMKMILNLKAKDIKNSKKELSNEISLIAYSKGLLLKFGVKHQHVSEPKKIYYRIGISENQNKPASMLSPSLKGNELLPFLEKEINEEKIYKIYCLGRVAAKKNTPLEATKYKGKDEEYQKYYLRAYHSVDSSDNEQRYAFGSGYNRGYKGDALENSCYKVKGEVYQKNFLEGYNKGLEKFKSKQPKITDISLQPTQLNEWDSVTESEEFSTEDPPLNIVSKIVPLANTQFTKIQNKRHPAFNVGRAAAKRGIKLEDSLYKMKDKEYQKHYLDGFHSVEINENNQNYAYLSGYRSAHAGRSLEKTHYNWKDADYQKLYLEGYERGLKAKKQKKPKKSKNPSIYRNNSKIWEFVPNFHFERTSIAERQGAIENDILEENLGTPKTDSACFSTAESTTDEIHYVNHELQQTESETESIESDTEEGLPLKWMTSDLKRVRYSNSREKEVTDCFIPLLSNNASFAIRFISAYQNGHPAVREFINSTKKAIQNKDDKSLNAVINKFKKVNWNKILPQEMTQIEVNAYKLPTNGEMVAMSKLRNHANPMYRFTLVEKNGSWHYLSEIK